jgi:amidase
VWSASVAANPLPFDQLEAHNQAFARRGQALGAAQLLQTHTSLQIAARAVIGATATVDAVLAPVLMAPPVPVGAYDGMSHEDLTDALARHLGLTPLINVTGQPAIAIPMHVTDEHLPIGVQLVGHPGGEAALIRLTAQLQEACRWDDWRPPGMEITHT